MSDHPIASTHRWVGVLSEVVTLDTSEVRWFARGAIPGPYVEWFTQCGRTGSVEFRSDVYDDSSYSGLGIKRRDGGPVEVKRLMGQTPMVHVDDSLVGRLEEWRKTTELSLGPGAGDLTSGWIEVEKVVLTRRFQLDESNGVTAVAVVEEGLPGCDVELASVTTGGRQSWTYAFEAYGPHSSRLDVIRRSAAAVTAGASYPPGFVADLALSVGYPEWLSPVER